MGTKIDLITACLKERPMTIDDIADRYIADIDPKADRDKVISNIRSTMYRLRKQKYVIDKGCDGSLFWMLI